MDSIRGVTITTEVRGVDVEGTYYLIRLVSMLTHIIDGVPPLWEELVDSSSPEGHEYGFLVDLGE